jgi:hypothetical protein
MKFKVFSTIAFLVILNSCSSPYETIDDEDLGEMSSTAGSNESHNMGRDCMSCHKPGGGEAPIWKVAGTVYNEAGTTTYPAAMVKLYTGPDRTGTLKYTLQVDAKGNFYTGGNIDFSGGLYPSVIGKTSTNSMSSPITTGSCNSCHNGTSRSRIWTN